MFLSKSLSEKELLKDLIMSEKELAYSYNNTIMESPSQDLRKLLSSCLADTQDTQHSIYNALEKRGWSKVQVVSQRDVDGIIQRYSSMV